MIEEEGRQGRRLMEKEEAVVKVERKVIIVLDSGVEQKVI
jgi:hypothetical protein